MALTNDYEHLIRIRLRTNNIYDLDSRIQEITTIREWIEELVEWQPAMYKIERVSSTGYVLVWFKSEIHAAHCALRWS